MDAITDDDVQAQIDENLKDKAEPVSDAAKEGDLVTVNYTGTKDGQTFDGGTANNYDFVIGDGQMFEEFENDVIVTADDDALYPENWLEGLWDTHEKYPGCVCCYRAHKITFEGGRVAPYQEWYGLSPDKKGPSEALFPVGVGGCCILQAISAASSSTAGRL